MAVVAGSREQKRISFSGIEVKADISERTISAYAATWDVDVLGDRIQKGAFRKTLQERGPNLNGRSKIKVLWQHRDPIGVPIRMEEDERGLLVTFRVAPTRLGDEALTLASMGIVDSMSIGFDVVQFDMVEVNGKLLRLLKELRLYEVSLVTFPANEAAQVLSVKDLSEGDLGTIVDRVAEIVETRLRGRCPEIEVTPPSPSPVLSSEETEPPSEPETSEVDLPRSDELHVLLDAVSVELKAGRVLSSRNRKLVEEAISALQALQEAASPEEPDGIDESKSRTTPPPSDQEPPNETVPDPDLIQSAVRKAFEGRFSRLVP